MSSSLSFGSAFKVKVKHFRAILGLPLHLAQEYFSQVLGYVDFFEAQRSGFVMRELASRAHLAERIREVVPGIPQDKVEQLVNELNLPTGDRVIAQLREGSDLSADFSRYFSPDGTFSEYYHQCRREVAPIFAKLRKLSAALGTFDREEVDIRNVLASLEDLSREDANTGLGFLSSCYVKYGDFLPVNVAMAMLVLHGAGAERSARHLARKAMAVFNGMMGCAVAAGIFPKSYSEVRSELTSYGLAIAAMQRRLGAHDVCLEVLDGLARLYPADADRFDLIACAPIRWEAAFAALFARRFRAVLKFLPTTSDGRRIGSYPAFAIEAIARAEMGDESQAEPLIDVLLCNQEIRLGLGLDNGSLISRRRPETMPLKDDTLDQAYAADLDRLRYLDLAAFSAAHALFLKRDKRMLNKLAASTLVFKQFRIFPDLQFVETRAKRKLTLDISGRYMPAVVSFGPAYGEAHFDVVVIRRSDFGWPKWFMPPQLAQVFKGNAYFEQDPTRKRWLAHILSSGHVEKINDGAGLRIKSGLGLWEKYRPGPDLARDEISFTVFSETEQQRLLHTRDVEFQSIADDLAVVLVDVYRQSLVGHVQ